MVERIKRRWAGPGGCREVLAIALPLILSTGTHTIQMFIDRMFLNWHSVDEMSAAMPAGIISFAIFSLFFGTVNYVNTFVAQYTGAERPHRVGASVWQGIYVGLASGFLLYLLIPLAESLFRWVDHAPEVQTLQVSYFRILVMGAPISLVGAALGCFFTGRGKTWTVLACTASGVAVNLSLDYCWIFGNCGFPEMGIVGAGWATVIGNAFGALLFAILFFRRSYRHVYATIKGIRPDFDLIKRLLRYGLPNGVQFMIDVAAFAMFVVFVGRIDKLALTATNTAFQINMLAFLPMIGFGIAVTTLVGQALGRNQPDLAQRATWSAAYMTVGYMGFIASCFVLVPQVFLFPFAAGAEAEQYAVVAALTRQLLVFVAFYCLFDVGNIIFAAALKGAGDTRYVMVVMLILSWGILVLPSYLVIRFGVGPRGGLFVAWGFAAAYVCALSAMYLLRFLGGKWRHMRVIEHAEPIAPLPSPSPTATPAESIS